MSNNCNPPRHILSQTGLKSVWMNFAVDTRFGLRVEHGSASGPNNNSRQLKFMEYEIAAQINVFYSGLKGAAL